MYLCMHTCICVFSTLFNYVHVYIIYVHIHVNAYIHLKTVLRTNVSKSQSIFSIKNRRTQFG